MAAALGADQLSRLLDLVPLEEIETHELLAYAPRRIGLADIDAVVAYTFGNRVAADGAHTAGPVNEALADCIESMLGRRDVPVFAQWEIADLLEQRGHPVHSIGPDIDDQGATVYLSTAGVAAKARRLAAAQSMAMHDIGVIAFADHAVRCVHTTRTDDARVGVPDGVALPTTYNPRSGQPWTRDRASYLSVDLFAAAGRPALTTRWQRSAPSHCSHPGYPRRDAPPTCCRRTSRRCCSCAGWSRSQRCHPQGS